MGILLLGGHSGFQAVLQATRGFWLFGGGVQFGSQHPFFHNFSSLDELTPVYHN